MVMLKFLSLLDLNLWPTDQTLIQILSCDIGFLEKSNKDINNL